MPRVAEPDAKTSSLRNKLLHEISRLQHIVRITSPLMADNLVVTSMERIEGLRKEYADAAWEEHLKHVADVDAIKYARTEV